MAEEPTDPRIQQLIDLERLINRDTTTPEEVGEALHFILNIILDQGKQRALELNEGLADAKREDKNLFDKVRRLISAATSDAKKDDKKIRKLVDGLLEWKTEQEKSTTGDDATTALEIAEENTAALRKIRISLKKLKREPGPRGRRGPAPDHEWEGTSLRFKNPDDTWGEWVDLQGMPGVGGGGFGGGPAGIGIFGITANGTSGPASISPGGILNIPQYTGGAGTTLSDIDPTSGVVDDTNLVFVFATKPYKLSVNQRLYRQNHGWTWNAGTGEATLSATDPGPVGTGGEIYGIIQS